MYEKNFLKNLVVNEQLRGFTSVIIFIHYYGKRW